MDNLKIIKITSEKDKFFGQVCDWMYEWWGKRDGWSFEKLYCFMKNCLLDKKIPQTFIAVLGDKLVGTYQLVMDDLDIRPDIYPWLANLFVDEKYRGRGFCTLMVENAIDQARLLGFSKLYLISKHVGLYEKFGWKFVEEIKTFNKANPIERLYAFDL